MQDIIIIVSALFVAFFSLSAAILTGLEVRRYLNWPARFSQGADRANYISHSIKDVIRNSLIVAALACVILTSTGIIAAIIKAWLGSGLI
jgi:hypothetical protein